MSNKYGSPQNYLCADAWDDWKPQTNYPDCPDCAPDKPCANCYGAPDMGVYPTIDLTLINSSFGARK